MMRKNNVIHKNERWGDEYNYFNKKKLYKELKSKICGVCLEKLGEDKELHHITYYCDGGDCNPENICLLHSECHKKLHRQDKNLFRRIRFKKKLLKLKKDGII